MKEKEKRYLLDTHTLIFWSEKTLSKPFITFLNRHDQQGRVFVSPVSFWETALLIQKGRVSIADAHEWRREILKNTDVRVLNPTGIDMINSAQLPTHHKDPFDRLMVAQAIAHDLIFVTRDGKLKMYNVETFWMK